MEGGREGVPMRGQETDHVNSGPMRGLKKMYPMAQTNRQTNRQTDGHGDSLTELAQWGRFSENYENVKLTTIRP